jgi:peptidoglycan hydrolase FlgJ
MNLDPVSPLSPAPLAARADGAAPPKPTPEQLAKAAQQFEAIMVRQLLAPSIEPMMSGGSLGGGEEGGASSGGGVYGYMLTDVLATAVTQGGGLGLAGVITRQLKPATSLKALS